MERKLNFKKLTPVNNADISVYKEAMDFIFENADVKNVAISGAYSSGKSSILESYKVGHPKKRFVHLSLAHFRSSSEQEVKQSNDTVKESVLEGKILNQLIHQIPAEKIPQTNFRVKKGINSKSLIKMTVFLSLLIGAILFLIFSNQIASFINSLPDTWVKVILYPFANQYALIIAAFVSTAFAVIFIYLLIRAQKNKNIFRKISLQGNDIEIFEETDDSYFDKYLNEVLYLFENVEADVIVFEDMDRFNVSLIFQRLREINTLVNIHRKKELGGGYTPLRFFYLLRDDIFISKDRTKFFDFIVPIVPVVDSSNSYEQFRKHLKEGGLLDQFDQSFLQSLSLYIDDMRILKNIYNEFIIYFNRLNITDLDYNKMMAIIAYKNLFPRDFNDLQLAKGFIHELFDKKEELIKKEVLSLQGKVNELHARIHRAKNETLVSEQELEDAYEGKKRRLPTSYGSITAEGREQSKRYDLELTQRKQALSDKNNNYLFNLELEITMHEHKIVSIKSYSLKDLITRENDESVFAVTHTNEIGSVDEFKEIKSSDYFALLKFLINRGFIDEYYADYMTYFYDESMSTIDKTYLRRVTDRRGEDYTYALKEPRKVVESPVLRKVDFEQEETLNFDLLTYLLQNDTNPKYSSYIETLLVQIQNTENFDFISRFYEMARANQQFVVKINEQWPDFFCIALKHRYLSVNQIRRFSIDTLYFSDDASIEAVNTNNCLTEYISNCSDFLEIENPNIYKLISGFSFLDVLFKAIDFESADKALFSEIYEQCLFELNWANITLMLKTMYKIESDDDIIHRNYTTIESNTDSPLSMYISINMQAYIDIILKNCDGYINDDERIAISLINNDNVGYATKEQYIKLLSTKITELSEVTDTSIWTLMLVCKIVEISVKNVVDYFTMHEMDAALIEFINSESEVDFSLTSEAYGEEKAINLFDAVSVCNEIDTEKYKKILIDLHYRFDRYEATEIADDKFKILIKENILEMDDDSLKYVRDKYPKHILAFIIRNFDEYLALQSAEIFSLDETLQILTWNVDDNKKIELLAITDKPISVINKRYTDAVNAHLIKYNLKVEDKPSLYENYSKYGSQTQTAINNLAISGYEEIIANDMNVDDALLSVLLLSGSIARGYKMALFTNAIPRLNEDTCINHFDELGLPDLKNIFTRGGSRRKYDKSDEVTTIFDALKVHRWIYDYRPDERNSEKYYITKNKPKDKELEYLD